MHEGLPSEIVLEHRIEGRIWTALQDSAGITDFAGVLCERDVYKLLNGRPEVAFRLPEGGIVEPSNDIDAIKLAYHA